MNITHRTLCYGGFIIRLERLSIRRDEGKAKVSGTLLGLGGAMLLTFYKGVQINLYSSHVNLLNSHPPDTAAFLHPHHNLLLGSILAVCCCLSLSIWFIIQVIDFLTRNFLIFHSFCEAQCCDLNLTCRRK